VSDPGTLVPNGKEEVGHLIDILNLIPDEEIPMIAKIRVPYETEVIYNEGVWLVSHTDTIDQYPFTIDGLTRLECNSDEINKIFCWAATNGDMDLVYYFCDKINNLYPGLLAATIAGNSRIVEFLLTKNIDLSTNNYEIFSKIEGNARISYLIHHTFNNRNTAVSQPIPIKYY
jgi:hypothetical protein